MNRELGGVDGSETPPKKTSKTSEKPSGKKPDITVFHQKAKAAGAYEKISERERMLMEAYFTTPATYEDLRSLAGGVSASRVRRIIDRGLAVLWHRYLPREMREEYERELPGGGGRVRRSAQDFELPNKRGKRK